MDESEAAGRISLPLWNEIPESCQLPTDQPQEAWNWGSSDRNAWTHSQTMSVLLMRDE